jgi:hypothetical protein
MSHRRRALADLAVAVVPEPAVLANDKARELR